MPRIALLGATGSLGSHVLRQAVAAGHDVSVLVRRPSRLPEDLRTRVAIHTGDLLAMPTAGLAAFIRGHDVLVSCAGLVTEGDRFVTLFDRVVTAAESLGDQAPATHWFLAGAGLLDLDASGRRGVDLPKVRDTYWPHRINFDRLRSSPLHWRMLCPGPMVEAEPVGLKRVRIAVDGLPDPLPAWMRHLPGPLLLPSFVRRIPSMIVPYADAAAFMLANMAPAGHFDRRRIGLALPAGMKGTKEHWAARPRETN